MMTSIPPSYFSQEFFNQSCSHIIMICVSNRGWKQHEGYLSGEGPVITYVYERDTLGQLKKLAQFSCSSMSY